MFLSFSVVFIILVYCEKSIPTEESGEESLSISNSYRHFC